MYNIKSSQSSTCRSGRQQRVPYFHQPQVDAEKGYLLLFKNDCIRSTPESTLQSRRIDIHRCTDSNSRFSAPQIKALLLMNILFAVYKNRDLISSLFESLIRIKTRKKFPLQHHDTMVAQHTCCCFSTSLLISSFKTIIPCRQ